MSKLDITKLTADLSGVWAGFLRDWDRTQRRPRGPAGGEFPNAAPWPRRGGIGEGGRAVGGRLRPPSEAEVPADLFAAIAADPAAQAMFEVLTSANRFALIHRLNTVKRAQTRERKIGEFVAMLARQETIYPQKAKPPNSP
jgi:hypothetical protein